MKYINNEIKFIELIIENIYLEFIKIAKQCSIGFLIMGAIGFVIKLIFLMINNILLSYS